MPLFSEKFFTDAALGLVSALVVTGLWLLFVWANNSYVVRRGGGLLKYQAWRIFFTGIFVGLLIAISHSYRQ
jgi:hypothetical protein